MKSAKSWLPTKGCAPGSAAQVGVLHEGVADHVADAHLGILDPAIVGVIDHDGLAGLLGHADIPTTQIYLHTAQQTGVGIRSPLDG